MTKDEVDKNIRERLRAGGSVKFVEGAFGDMPACGGYVEDEGDWGMRFYGCSKILRGTTEPRVIDSVALTKRAILSFLHFFPFLMLFPKRLTHWIAEVYRADLATKEPKEFSRPFRELIRVGSLLVSGLKNRDDALCVVKCAAMCLMDVAYRLRVQDVLGVLCEDALWDNPRREVLRLLKLGRKREHDNNRMQKKWDFMYRLASIVLWFPSVKRFAKRSLQELDRDEVRIDADDWYFCLKRESYDFRGMSLGERLVEKERIDKENEFVALNL